MGEGRPPDIMNPEPRSGLFSSREAILETVIRRDHAQGSSVVGMIGTKYFLLLFTIQINVVQVWSILLRYRDTVEPVSPADCVM